jgi:hypothetical protein
MLTLKIDGPATSFRLSSTVPSLNEMIGAPPSRASGSSVRSRVPSNGLHAVALPEASSLRSATPSQSLSRPSVQISTAVFFTAAL